MAKYTIHKGRHRAVPLRFGIWRNKSVLRRLVCFNVDCKYWLNDPDQDDVNKLFGIGYFPSHHQNSARFGWRYNKETSKIIISAYVYSQKSWVSRDLCEISVNTRYHFILSVNPSFYEFQVQLAETGLVIKCASVSKLHKQAWAYPLGIYFGGNQTAPETMHIEMTKL